MKTNYSVSLTAFRKSKDYATSKKAMLNNGMNNPCIDNILTIAFTKGWNATNIKLVILEPSKGG